MVSRDVARVLAIQCVAELGRAVQVLESEVTAGAPRRDLLDTLATTRRVLRMLEDFALRDGRTFS